MHYCKNQKPSSQALAFNESATYVRIKSFIKKIISKLNKKNKVACNKLVSGLSY